MHRIVRHIPCAHISFILHWNAFSRQSWNRQNNKFFAFRTNVWYTLIYACVRVLGNVNAHCTKLPVSLSLDGDTLKFHLVDERTTFYINNNNEKFSTQNGVWVRFSATRKDRYDGKQRFVAMLLLMSDDWWQRPVNLKLWELIYSLNCIFVVCFNEYAYGSLLFVWHRIPRDNRPPSADDWPYSMPMPINCNFHPIPSGICAAQCVIGWCIVYVLMSEHVETCFSQRSPARTRNSFVLYILSLTAAADCSVCVCLRGGFHVIRNLMNENG